MAEPVCAKRAPYAVELEPGTYYWCSCGKSANQPFCDGAHKGAEFKPLAFTVERSEEATQEMYLCGCKATTSPPVCDGSCSVQNEYEKTDA